MLPKPEKTKKLNKNLLADSEITKESDEVIAAKRLKTKRRLVLFSLGLTVGLSFIFWSFRSIQTYIKSPKSFDFHPSFNFQLPKFNFKTNQTSQVSTSDTEIQNFLKDKNWSVSSIFTSNLTQSVFSFNSSTPSQIDINQLLSIAKTDQSLINLNLPQGLLFQEKVNNENSLSYQNLITLPSTQLFISVTIPNISDLNQVKTDLSQLVDMLYWYSVSRLSSD